jgi:TolA-binding protein
MGDAFYNTKLYDSARVYYTNVLEQYPQSPLAADALSGLEFTYRAEGKPNEAITAIEKYVSAKPAGANQEDLLLKKADILFDQSDFPAAIQEYQHILTMKPDRSQQVKALQQMGRGYELENNPSQAIPYYQQVVNDFSDVETAPSIALALGLAFIKTKQFSQAKDVFKSFEQKFPTSPLLLEAHYHLGMTMLELKDSTGGFNQFQSVIRQNPTDIFAERSRLQLASLHQRRRQYQASIDTLEGVVTRRNDDLAAEALLIMGDDYLMMKRNGDALQAFLDVIEQYTEFNLQVERAKLGAGDAYTHLMEKKKAKKLYQEIIASPVNPDMKKEAQARLKRLR